MLLWIAKRRVNLLIGPLYLIPINLVLIACLGGLAKLALASKSNFNSPPFLDICAVWAGMRLFK